MEERKTVKIRCNMAGGLRLYHFRDVDDGTGVRQRYHHGAPVILRGSSSLKAGVTAPDGVGDFNITEVDAAWWSKWVEQNKGKNPLYDLGHISEVEEEPANPTQP